MTREELTLKAIATYNGNLHSGMTTALGAVVDMVLDHAVWIAENFPVHDHGNLATAPYAAAELDRGAGLPRELGV